MSSNRDQASAGGNVSVGGARSAGDGGELTAAQKRAALNNASVSTRALADKGEALDKALVGSEFQTVEGQYRAMDGENLLKSMFNNPQLMAYAGQAWTQQKMQSEGLERRFADLELNPGEASRQEIAENVRNQLAYMSLNGETIDSLPEYMVEDLQENLRRLDMYHGDSDGYAGSPGFAAAVGMFVAADASTEELLKRGSDVIEAPDRSSPRAQFAMAHDHLRMEPVSSGPTQKLDPAPAFRVNEFKPG